MSTTTDRLVNRDEVYKLLNVSSETFRRWLRDGKFPPPDVDISKKTRMWRLSTLQASGIKLL